MEAAAQTDDIWKHLDRLIITAIREKRPFMMDQLVKNEAERVANVIGAPMISLLPYSRLDAMMKDGRVQFRPGRAFRNRWSVCHFADMPQHVEEDDEESDTD